MIQTGLDRLFQDPSVLQGRRVGLITNATGIDSHFRSGVHLFQGTPYATLTALFAPEHGLYATQPDGRTIPSSRATSGVPVYSLYGEHRRPTAEMLHDVDLLVYDIQDVGARFYTFISTLAEVLEAAAEHALPVWVLDRPNPITGTRVEGPLLRREHQSFVGPGPLPIRHGMTPGELALFFCEERRLDLDLHIWRLEGWRRTMWFDETGLPWVMPSPNMPTLDTATVYPGTCLLEGTNVSEGRGTTRPFEILGAPWIDGEAFAQRLRSLALPGVAFRPCRFLPAFSKYQGEECGGVQVHVLDRERFASVATGCALITTLREMYPDKFTWRQRGNVYAIDRLAGTTALRHQVDAGASWEAIVRSWESEVGAFQERRTRWLLYEP